MKIKVLGVFGSEGQGQRPSAFLVNDRVLVDAGSVPGALNVDEQRVIEHALPTHAPQPPVLGYRTLAEDVESRVGELWVTPIRVDHTVDAVGFVIHDGETGVGDSGDP